MGNNKDKEEQIPYEDWLEREKPLVKALHAATPQLNLVRTYDPPPSKMAVDAYASANKHRWLPGMRWSLPRHCLARSEATAGEWYAHICFRQLRDHHHPQ